MEPKNDSGDAAPEKKEAVETGGNLTRDELVARLVERRQKAKKEPEDNKNGKKDQESEGETKKSVENVADNGRDEGYGDSKSDAEDKSSVGEEDHEEDSSADSDTHETDESNDKDKGEDVDEDDALVALLGEDGGVDESKQPKSVQKLLKKLRREVAQKYSYKEKYEELRQKSESSNGNPMATSNLSVEDLDKQALNASEAVDFINDTLDSKPPLDEDGNELPYQIKLGNQDVPMTREQLMQRRRELNKLLRFEIPQQKADLARYSQERAEVDKALKQSFDWVDKTDNPYHAVLSSWKSDERVRRLLREIPEAELILAAGVERISDIVSKRNAPKEQPKPKAQKPVVSTSVPKQKVSTGENEDIQKEIDSAFAKYQKSGSREDYTKYRALKLKKLINTNA